MRGVLVGGIGPLGSKVSVAVLLVRLVGRGRGCLCELRGILFAFECW